MRTIDRTQKRSPRFLIPGLFVLAAFVFCFLPIWWTPGGPGLEILPDGNLASSDSDAAVPPDWWAETAGTIARMEYQITASDEGLQGPNRAQSLRTYFREGGIEVGPRSSTGAEWGWSWGTRSWGREGGLQALLPVEPSADAYRVEYRHPDFVEWYENGPHGVEQGFLLPERPAGAGALVIEGAWGGGLEARMNGAGDAIDFQTASGARVLRYDGLEVTDARGELLASSLELEGSAVRLRIDDSDAVYPVLVDPLLTTPDWTWEPDTPDVGFGNAVSTAGDVNGDGYSDLLVGAQRYDGGYNDEGAAFLFYGSASGLATSPAWSAESNQPMAYYGGAVSTAGDVNGDGYDDILVGSNQYDAGQVNEGRAYLYHGSSSGPSTSADWTAESNQTSAYFGVDVRGAGDLNGDGYADIVVGASSYTHDEVGEGRAFVYYGSASGLDPLPDWWADGNDPHAFFGRSVSGGGDVDGDGFDDLVVGAPNYTSTGVIGAVFVFHGSAAGLEAVASGQITQDDEISFGDNVSAAGDVDGDGYADIVIGAQHYDGGTEDRGRAYLYRGSASGVISSQAAWTFEGESSYANLGYSVGTAGDVNGDGYADVIVGSRTYSGDQPEEGRAYLFLGHATGLSEDPDWVTEGNQAFASYGTSVATAGDIDGDGYGDLVVGAEWYSNGEANEGCAFVYHGSPDGPRDAAGWVTESNQTLASYAYSVASAGDVNADGFDDVLVGAPYYDNGENDEGACFLFLGSEVGLAPIPAWYAEGNQEGASFGMSVAGAGDVNGDGLEDLLIGSPRYTDTFSTEGAAFVWYSVIGGGPPGNPSNSDWQATSGQAAAMFGFSVARAGDVNGDGFGDVIVGAFGYDNGQVDEGAAFLYHGSAGGLSTSSDWFHDSGHADASYGVSVSSAGDFNGDGFSDVIVGAYLYDHPTVGEGAAFVYLGSEDGIVPGAPYWYAESNEENGFFGFFVACAGDVNGDGLSDVVIGAPEMDTSAIDGGRAFVWHGAATAPPPGDPTNADWSAGRAEENAWFGAGVASAGDVNGDGYSDILIGAPLDTSPGGVERGGTAFVYLGSEDGVIGPGAYWIGESEVEMSQYGWRVASAGDVDGDGCSEILIGSPHYSAGSDEEGRGFLYYGNGGRGLARIPRQWESDLSAPIAPFGASEEESEFALLARVRTPAGRGVVRLVSEVQRQTSEWDETDAMAEDWVTTWAPHPTGGSYILDGRGVTGLYPGFLYKWRVRFESQNPLFPRSPWLYLSGNAAGEADLRMAGTISSAPEFVSSPELRLGAIGPNPFRERTSFTWSIPRESEVRLTVHDVQGRLVRTLVDGGSPAGSRRSSWDGRDERGTSVSAGVYWFRLSADGEQAVGRVVRVE